MRRRTNEALWWILVSTGPVLMMGAVGCHHRAPPPIVLPAQTPVPLVSVPPPADVPLMEAPKTKLPAVPVATEEARPKKSRRRQKPAPVASVSAAPVGATGAQGSVGPTKSGEDAPATAGDQTSAAQKAAETAAIGSLTVGGEQNPRTQQDATNLIAANERRLNGLNAETARTQATLVSQARNFQRQAQQALKSGDAEGAKTLATKSKLLLDDVDGNKGTP